MTASVSRLCSLVVMFAALGTSRADPPPGNAEAPKPLPPKVVAAWKEAGAEDGRMGRSLAFLFMDRMRPVPPHMNYFEFFPNEKGAGAELPAFRIVLWREGTLAKLPVPSTPFGLDLGATEVTNAGLKELAALTSLEALILNKTQVTDAGLQGLAELKNLQGLSLRDTEVTDMGLKQLAKLKKLKLLDVRKTAVTDMGVNTIEAALPGLEVHHEHEKPWNLDMPAFREALEPLPPAPRDFRTPPAAKPAEPFHWEKVPWGVLLIVGVLILIGAMAAGFYKARQPG
jgi:hypothetical protein